MEHENTLSICKITAGHICGTFDCGDEEMNLFLKGALAHQSSNKGVTYVAHGADLTVKGFYTVATASTLSTEVGEMEKFRLPSIVLARIAVDREYRGKKLAGEAKLSNVLISDFYRVAMSIASKVGVFTVMLHAANESLHGKFYTPMGFRSVASKNKMLMYQRIADLHI
jgi:GNAT superfamily N-acetyltransferase